MPSSSSIDPYHGAAGATDICAAAGAVVPSKPRAGRGRPEDFASFLRTQDEVDARCKEHGVPMEFTARPAGDLRANSTPPPGAICVYDRALEAGMPVPLHGFFREVLAHFGIAPAQLVPNGWRIMAGFLGLCHCSGVPPSLAVFRYFFLLSIVSKSQKKGWYFFRSRDSSGLRFTGMPNPNWISFKYWKHEFFFLSSPEPWPCPVAWGEPSERSFKSPVLAGEEKKSAAKLLRAHGGTAVDLKTYPCNSKIPVAITATALAFLPPPPPSSSTWIISSPEGMDPSVYAMMKTMLAEKAAAQASASASAKKVNAEPGSNSPAMLLLCGKKRSLEKAKNELASAERDAELEKAKAELAATRAELAEAKNELASAERDAEQEKAKAELAATRAELAKARAGLAAAEGEVVKAKAELTAAKRAADAGQEEARSGLAMDGAKAKLATAKRALEEELERAKAVAVQQLLCCDEDELVRRRAEHALEGYHRWRTGRSPAGRAA